jgi:hypothetical protein
MLKPANFESPGRMLLPLMLLLLSASAAGNLKAGRPPTPALAAAVNLQAVCPANQATDAAIVKAIQDKIKADTRFDDQRDHINVMSKNRAVKLEGWVLGAEQKQAIMTFAQTTDCVLKNKIKNLLKTERQGSCSPGQKPCCGGCIERSSTCNCINKQGG